MVADPARGNGRADCLADALQLRRKLGQAEIQEFAWPRRVTKRFAGLMSRWMMPCAWVASSASQRIGVRYAMAPMTPDETGAYLRHHTKLAGRSDQLFSDDAAELIHQASRGFPRSVNRLAAAALLATYTTHKTIADTTAVRAAITEVNDQ